MWSVLGLGRVKFEPSSFLNLLRGSFIKIGVKIYPMNPGIHSDAGSLGTRNFPTKPRIRADSRSLASEKVIFIPEELILTHPTPTAELHFRYLPTKSRIRADGSFL